MGTAKQIIPQNAVTVLSNLKLDDYALANQPPYRDEFSKAEPCSKTTANITSNIASDIDIEPPSVKAKRKARPVNLETVDEELAEKIEKLRSSAHALVSFTQSLSEKNTLKRPEMTQPSDEKVSDNEELEERYDFAGHQTGFDDLHGKSMIDTLFDFTLQVFKQPEVFSKRYANFARELMQIVQKKSDLQPERGDRRFRDAVWNENPVYRIVLQTYLSWSKEMNGMVDELAFDDENDNKRAQFILKQVSAAIAPSNSPLNPVAVKRAYQTGGQSVLAGLNNLVKDIKTNGGMPRQVSDTAYKVGEDLGVSSGEVIYRSRIFEIIQYGSNGQSHVHKRPILIIPPQINKFYIFDLTPKNSLVKQLIDSGLQTFIVSWKNPTEANANWSMDTYVEELDKGVQAILDISGSEDISLASACAGGITAMSLQAYYTGRNKKIIHNHTLLVTALNAEGHPTLDLFMNKNSVKHALERTQDKGVMNGKELAHVFAWLRPTDLVWNYWVNNNLLGKEPPTMDVLFWDNDSTRLPAALHHDFMDILVNNKFSPNKSHKICGEDVDLSKFDSDFYFLAGDEDYLMPWKGCYQNLKQLPNARCEFVLSNSGHIQSVLRPPGIGNTFYYTNDKHVTDADDWLAAAEKQKGSWWTHWCEWLTERSGEKRVAPAHFGSENYPPICASPGIYVFEK